jgi:DNA polymerase-3 subunit beta
MELLVRKADLLKELSLLQGIVERKNTIPILANVLLDAGKDGVSLLATDLDVGLRSRCDAKVSKPGVMTLPAKKLFEIVNALPDTEIQISEDKGGKSVTVAADRFESKMQTLPASEFPTPPSDAGAVEATLPGAALKRMIAHTRFAITSEDGRDRRPPAGLHVHQGIARQERLDRGAPAPQDAQRSRASHRWRQRCRVLAG